MAGDDKSPPVAMMPPAMVVAAATAPAVMMATTAAMSPSMTTAMTVAALDLDDSSIGSAESMRCRGGNCGRCSSRSKATECDKTNQCKFEFHGFLPVAFQNVAHSKKLNVNRR
jgi:hypothetical protein